MKKLFSITILIWLSLVFGACNFTPQSKSSYFEQYQAFITEIKQNKEEVSAEQWAEYDKKHDQFAVDFFQKYKKDMILEEKAKARKLGATYKVLRTKAKIKGIFPFKKK